MIREGERPLQKEIQGEVKTHPTTLRNTILNNEYRHDAVPPLLSAGNRRNQLLEPFSIQTSVKEGCIHSSVFKNAGKSQRGIIRWTLPDMLNSLDFEDNILLKPIDA